MAGYSGKPLFEKLGLKPGQAILLRNCPISYATQLESVKEPLQLKIRTEGPIDLIHFFTKSRKELEKGLPRLKQELDRNGCIWVSWPKKTSGVKTDLTEDVIRTAALDCGLVDIKVCAVDETWSGLKLVYRRNDRSLK